MTNKQWDAGYLSELTDEHMAVTGQVTEQLSEHQMEGFIEGYLLTGRHGIWSSYESFVHVIDSMLNQHAKWLEATVREIPWRKPISLDEPPGLLARLASGPTTASRTRIRVSPPCC